MEQNKHHVIDSSPPLSFEEGLQTIDAFYEEHRHLLEDEPQQQNHNIGSHDDFSTLMEDIEHLNPQSVDPPQPEVEQLDELMHDSASLDQQTVSDKEATFGTVLNNSLVDGSTSLDQATTEIQQCETRVIVQTARAQDSASPDQPAASSERFHTQVTLQDHLVQDEEALSHPQFPEIEVEMTPKQKEREQLPSSEGKSSLMDEMRSEETRYPSVTREVAAQPVINEQIQLPGITAQESEDVPQLDARSHCANLKTELNAVMMEDPQAPPNEVADSGVGEGVRPTKVPESSKKRMTRRTKQQASEEQHMFPDLPVEPVKEQPVDSVLGDKRKRDTEDSQADPSVAGNPAKKTRKPATRLNSNLSPTKMSSEAPANRRSSRNAVGKREISALAQQKPQRSNSNRRETRAEVAKGPNAGLAVKERRRAMERKDSEK